MKSILYVGAVFMVGASIYGFVDYKKTSRSKEFKALYQEEKEQPPVAEEVNIPVIAKNEDITEVKNLKEEKFTSKKKLAEDEMNEEVIEEKKLNDNSGEVFKTKKVKKERKLNYKLFSRAPLREYVDDPLPVKKEIKTEEAKSVNQ
ncbi:MAG: hypothetical protein WDN26_07650 [Chitinophagaceae bacterium]